MQFLAAGDHNPFLKGKRYNLVYMVENEKGEHSLGGVKPKFSKWGGKIWTNPENFFKHLDIVDPKYYKGCKIVCLTLLTDQEIPAEKWLKEKG